VVGSQNLIHCLKEQGIKKIIFSSSATVYGDPQYLPIDEDHPVQPFNPYGETKAQVEQLFMNDEYFKTASVSLLRYFNPVGSYKGIIGENPNGVPSNLMPYILGVAAGKYEYLNIYGDDYETEDGTGVRDYIHVMDLIEAHWFALMNDTSGCQIYNVGCGKGYSVKEMVKAFEKVNQVKIRYQIQPRRDGDIATCYAAVDKIKNRLHWSTQLNLEDVCRDAWKVNAS
jgi:UDP-glucose 4-epimerase